jgi:hypothetical protein
VTPRVSFPPPLPDRTFRGGEEGKLPRRKPAKPLNLLLCLSNFPVTIHRGKPRCHGGFHRCSPFLGALPCLSLRSLLAEPSLLAGGHPCPVRRFWRSVAFLDSSLFPCRRGCRSLHLYPRATSAERAREGGRNERLRPPQRAFFRRCLPTVAWRPPMRGSGRWVRELSLAP